MQLSCMFVLLLLVSTILTQTSGDPAKDREECAEQLTGLATCLPYVGGDAKSPTPDCCTGLTKLLKNNKKCLCVIVRDRNDPDLGLNINVTLALGLPSVCHAAANVTQCPALLNMDPNSPEAQVFYQFGNTTSNATSPAPASSVKGSSTGTSGNGEGPSAQLKSESCCNGKRQMCLEIGIVVLFLSTFF